jgi:hypothetical protein
MGVFFLSFGCGRALCVGKTGVVWWMAFWGFDLRGQKAKKCQTSKPAEIFNTWYSIVTTDDGYGTAPSPQPGQPRTLNLLLC